MPTATMGLVVFRTFCVRVPRVSGACMQESRACGGCEWLSNFYALLIFWEDEEAKHCRRIVDPVVLNGC